MFLTVLDGLTKLLVPSRDPEFGGYNICDVKTMIKEHKPIIGVKSGYIPSKKMPT